MKPPRLRLPRSAIAALAFVAAAALCWWWVAMREGRLVRFPDGREVSVLTVTYGTNHVFVEGPLWARVARRFVSLAKAYRLGLRIYERNTSTPTLMIWTVWRLPSTNRAPRFAAVRDRHGVESEPEVAAVEVPVAKSTGPIMAWNLANYPRRQGEILLRFYERDAAYRPHGVGELPVRISGRGRAAPWHAPVPPVRIERDGREFALVALRGGEPAPSELKWPYVFIAPWTTALFEVREQGQPNEGWTIKGLELLDATGNHLFISQPRVLWVNGQLATAFPHVLWADEPDWKFVVEFSPTRDFVAEDLCTFQSLPAIRNQGPFTTNCAAVVHGVSFQSLDLRATSQVTRLGRDGYRRTTDLTLIFTSAVQRVRVDLARVRDDRGRELRFGRGWEPWPGKFTTGLEVPIDATSLDLTFAVHPCEFVEFLVRPDLGSARATGP